MPSTKQRSAARKNIKKAATAARKKKTIAHLPKSTRTLQQPEYSVGGKRRWRAQMRLLLSLPAVSWVILLTVAVSIVGSAASAQDIFVTPAPTHRLVVSLI